MSKKLVSHLEQVEELVLLRVGHHGHLDGVGAEPRVLERARERLHHLGNVSTAKAGGCLNK